MLSRVLPRQDVEVAHPLHSNEERLVLRQAGLVQIGDLLAKMILELVDVAAVDAGALADVLAPLCDLRLEASTYASPTAASNPPPGQTLFSARLTAAHCRCCSASAARPSFVIT